MSSWLCLQLHHQIYVCHAIYNIFIHTLKWHIIHWFKEIKCQENKQYRFESEINSSILGDHRRSVFRMTTLKGPDTEYQLTTKDLSETVSLTIAWTV